MKCQKVEKSQDRNDMKAEMSEDRINLEQYLHLHLPVDSRLQLVEDYAMLLPHGAGEDVRFSKVKNWIKTRKFL